MHTRFIPIYLSVFTFLSPCIFLYSICFLLTSHMLSQTPKHVIPACVLVFQSFAIQFPLSTLSWEYGQGQSLIIQADFKCFQLSVKVECWNQETLSGCYFNQATVGIRHTCVSQLCCHKPEKVWSFGLDLGFV